MKPKLNSKETKNLRKRGLFTKNQGVNKVPIITNSSRFIAFAFLCTFYAGIHDSLWFKHITGFFEKDLRVDDNILKCLIPRKVEGFEKFGAEGSGYAFTFKNVENGNTFDAGYFYFDSIQNMESTVFPKPEGSTDPLPRNYKGCSFFVEVCKDRVNKKSMHIYKHKHKILSPLNFIRKWEGVSK